MYLQQQLLNFLVKLTMYILFMHDFVFCMKGCG